MWQDTLDGWLPTDRRCLTGASWMPRSMYGISASSSLQSVVRVKLCSRKSGHEPHASIVLAAAPRMGNLTAVRQPNER